MAQLLKRGLGMNLKENVYVDSVPRDIEGILAVDIGGTNSNFGIFQFKSDKLILLISVHAKSQEVDDFPQLVKEVLEFVKSRYEITIYNALFACAGVVSPERDRSAPTNLPWGVDAHAIKHATGLECLYIVNDFEVIGYGLDLIDPKNLVKVHKGTERMFSNKAIVGSGTGLGKCIMFWSHRAHRYIPVASEGGHADFSAQHSDEMKLIEFIQKTEGFDCNISWEDLLSGEGIKRIYRFFYATGDAAHREKEEAPHPDEIFKSRNHDEHSKHTFELYTRFYARCAKNFVLDALALGGVFIAGGIAANNLPLFQLPEFMQEFINCGKMGHYLKEVPIYVVTDYNVSLYGAAHYLILEGLCRSN